MLALGVLCLALSFWIKVRLMQNEIDELREELDKLRNRVAQKW